MNDGSDRPANRPAVGYILKMFPRLSETFILHEILELERQGASLRIFSLKRPADAVVHAQAALVRAPIVYLPQRFAQAPLAILGGQWHAARRYRRRWRRALAQALKRARADRDSDALLVFCQACCIIRHMGDIRHLHAHYASIPAKIALLVQRIAGTSYSITTHAKDIFQNDPLASPKLHERIARARFVVANSQFSAGHIRTKTGSQGDVYAVYNGLDLEAFPMRMVAPGEPVILSVGRLVPKKGFSDLIKACELLKRRGVRFRCELVGTGQLSSTLKEHIRESGVGDRIALIGPLPQQVLRTHYERAMVFALPCIEAADGDRDILPNVLKEAMAVGVPIVTTRLDGIEELIEDGASGLLVAPGDASALAEKLELLLHDAALRERITRRAREVIVERFDRRKSFDKLKSLLDEALASRSSPQIVEAQTDFKTHDASCLR